jgi:hypothetical protein
MSLRFHASFHFLCVQRALVKNRELAKARLEAEVEHTKRKRSSATTEIDKDTTAFGDSCTPVSLPVLANDDDGPGTRILIYSHSLPPWVDGVSTRFKAHCKMLKEEGHRVRLETNLIVDFFTQEIFPKHQYFCLCAFLH